MKRIALIAYAILALLGSCVKDPGPRKVLDHFIPDIGEFPEMVYPEDNPKSAMSEELGKLLFFDTRLSIDNSISCGSCHKSELAFSDGLTVSKGVNDALGTRNSPSLGNVGYLPYFTREGGVPSLEMQILVPIQEHNEFNHNIVNIVKQLSTDSLYDALSKAAYNREFDAFVLVRAIANFERSLVTNSSRFDRYVYERNYSVYTDQEEEGLRLFYSEKTNCSSCHGGFNFTNNLFENNGLYNVYADSGRARFTGNATDRARFKVPSLRNVAVTGPYMHDGSISHLEEVINHYNEGGEEHPSKSSLIKPLNLTEQEKKALVAFLKTLTDEDFMNKK
ncbi:c-type cytochrome [bacterium]|nr:c-type cytochrome [bacterium]